MVDNSCHPLLIAPSLSADSLLIIIKMWDGMEGGMATIFWQSQKLQFCSGLTIGLFSRSSLTVMLCFFFSGWALDNTNYAQEQEHLTDSK